MSDLPSNYAELINKGTIIKEGDTNFIFLVKLTDSFSKPVDLTEAKSIVVYSSNSDNVLLFSLEATKATSEGNGFISFSFGEDNLTGNGIIKLQFNVTYENGRIEKFPSDGYTTIKITPSLDNLENVSLSTYSITQIIDLFNDSLKTTREELLNDINQTNMNLSHHTDDKDNPHAVTKAQVGLGDVDNTSDLNKPVSTAQQAALDEKANKTDVGIIDAIDASVPPTDIPTGIHTFGGNRDMNYPYSAYTVLSVKVSNVRCYQVVYQKNGSEVAYRTPVNNGETWTGWQKIATKNDLPTKLSQLEDDIGASGNIDGGAW